MWLHREFRVCLVSFNLPHFFLVSSDACCFWITLFYLLFTITKNRLAIGYQMMLLFNHECSCWKTSTRVFPHWTFLPCRNGETSIFERFWCLLTFSTRLQKNSSCLSSGVNSNVMKFVIYPQEQTLEQKEVCKARALITTSWLEPQITSRSTL